MELRRRGKGSFYSWMVATNFRGHHIGNYLHNFIYSSGFELSNKDM